MNGKENRSHTCRAFAAGYCAVRPTVLAFQRPRNWNNCCHLHHHHHHVAAAAGSVVAVEDVAAVEVFAVAAAGVVGRTVTLPVACIWHPVQS